MLFGMVSGPSDVELVRRFKSGDRSAYAEIVRRYQHRIFTLCVRWIGDERTAEDLSQDVFIALYRSLDDFRGDAQLSTWIYRVAINHCKNRRMYQKRRATDRHEPLEGSRGDDEPARELPHGGPSTDAGAYTTEAERTVRAALDQLDEDARSIIVMRDIDDLSYEEIADVLDLPRGTVKSRLNRARAELARVLSRTLKPEDV